MSNKNILKIILFIFLSSNIIGSDGRLHLIHADKSIGKILNGEKVRYLVGNVKAYKDTFKMLCDEAIFFEDKDRAEFIGNVLIDDSHHKLWANKIIYFTDTRIAHCLGNVRISGDTDSLYAEKFIYDFRTKNTQATKNVYLWDKENNVRIKGDAGSYNAAFQESHILGNAWFEHHQPNEPDTLIITSKKMAYYGIEPKRAIAEDSVRIFKGSVSAVCDSGTYFISQEKVSLRINPVTWQGDSEMIAEMIDFSLDSLKIDEIILYEKAQIKTLADSIEKKYNILKGKTIHITMMDDVPERVIARRNAISVYQVEDNKIKQGTNSASSDSIIVYFKEGEVDSISIMGGGEGTFYPADWKGEIKSDY